MAAMLRVKPDAAAVGRTSKLSPMLEPLKRSVSVPACAFDGVAAVARVPLERVVAAAERGRVGALVAVDEVVAVAAEQRVVAVAAENGVVAAAAVDRDAR